MCTVTEYTGGFEYVEIAQQVVESLFNGQRKQMFTQMDNCAEKSAMLDYIKTNMGVTVAYNVCACYFAQQERQP